MTWLDRIHVGDCRILMREMIGDGVRVQCVVTSPPYWGLRDYGVPGQFGLERTWVRHLARMRGVFRQVHQLLEDDGLLWLNYGDSYYTRRTGGGIGHNSTINGQRGQQEFRRASRAMKAQLKPPDIDGPNRRRQPRIKDKDLVGMPWMLALALRFDPRATWWLRSDVVWNKRNPMPESVTDRPTKAHEYVFMLSRSQTYYYDLMAVAEPASPDSHARAARGRSDNHKWANGPGGQTIARQSPVAGRLPGVNPKAGRQRPVAGWAEHGDHTPKDHARAEKGLRDSTKFGRGAGWRSKQNESFSAAIVDPVAMRNLRTVWTFPTEAFRGTHFATFPRELVQRCVLSSSRPGDVIFDPFMGSGTVAEVAQSLGRRFIGCELNPEYAGMFERHRSQQQGIGL